MCFVHSCQVVMLMAQQKQEQQQTAIDFGNLLTAANIYTNIYNIIFHYFSKLLICLIKVSFRVDELVTAAALTEDGQLLVVGCW